ncbi:hypothetical protein BH20GEM2_BH20GEM2_20600 [soil metagenome]
MTSARVLVVDDQRIPRVAVSRVLEEAGYAVAAEESGRRGIERAHAWNPDVIILDVHMPEMDGFAVVEALKRNEDTAPIPVIFLTATAPRDELVVKGLDLGAYDFLSKGCSRAELLARVGVMTQIKRGYDELKAIARVSDTLVRTLEPAELARLFVEQIKEVFRADAALLQVAAENEHGSGLTAASGLRSDGREVETFGSALLEQLSGRAEESVDLAALGDAGEIARSHGFASAIGVRVDPTDGKPPVLLAGFAEREDAFRGPSDAALLRLLANQAITALDHALLHARTREQAEHLARAMSERSRFFASMSHELRTPINAVMGYGQLLEDEAYGKLDEKQAHAVGRIRRSAQHILELVNDVLDISKIEAGKLEIIPERTDLCALLRDTLTSLHLQAKEKELELSVDAPASLTVSTDPARLRQILLNLLSNAIKFTEEGVVRVSVVTLPRTEDPADPVAEIRVTDTGPGIDLADQRRVFNEFEQVEGSAASGGTGLGLAISLRLAHLLGGELTLVSRSGEGSEFTLLLPASVPPPEAREDGE